MNKISWDQYFMSMAYLVAMRSKDESTHVGSIIVGSDNGIISSGYNSYPRKCDDDVPERQERPEKYFWFEHSERNAIYAAAKKGIVLEGCTMYTLGIPCSDCARGIIQAGIKRVIVHRQWMNGDNREKWIESAKRSGDMFFECGVVLEYYNGSIITEITGFRNGEKIIL